MIIRINGRKRGKDDRGVDGCGVDCAGEGYLWPGVSVEL